MILTRACADCPIKRSVDMMRESELGIAKRAGDSIHVQGPKELATAIADKLAVVYAMFPGK